MGWATLAAQTTAAGVRLKLPFRKKQASQPPLADRRGGLFIEHGGENRIDRVVSAVEQVPWSVSLLELAWTAGPVTFLAAQGGYWLGFGKLLPTENLLFFVGYTVIAGLVGVLAKMVHTIGRAARHRQRQDSLTLVIDRLPDLIFAVRNLSLEPYQPEARRREAAALLLRKGEPSPDTLHVAVEELTGSQSLARAAHYIGIFRRNGLQNRVRDLQEEVKAQLEMALAELHQVAPEAAEALEQHFEGRPPLHKSGVQRQENFIERVLAAIEEGNADLMTLRDVEEMIVLAFELVSGRAIPMLYFKYKGHWRLGRATDALERARSQYRVAMASGYSRLMALAVYLLESEVTETSDVAAGLDADALLDRTQAGMERLIEDTFELRYRIRLGDRSQLPALRERVGVLQRALDLYEAVRSAYSELGRAHAHLLSTTQRWEALTQRMDESKARLRTGYGRAGLRIWETQIRLDERQIVTVARALAEHLRAIRIRRQSRRFAVHALDRPCLLTIDSAKGLAIEIALALEPHIHISRPEVQRAIDSSNASYLGVLEPSLTASAKAAYGEAMAKEVRRDLSRAAERLAVALVRDYRIDLTEEAVEFLQHTYGARSAALKPLLDYTRSEDRAPYCLLRRRPPLVPKVPNQWRAELRKAAALLERFRR